VVIVGGNRLARVLGDRLASAGREVVYVCESATRASQGHPGTAAVDACHRADLVVLAVPFSAVAAVLASCGSLAGTLVWSCVNAVGPNDDGLAVGFTDSAAETVARLVPRARVVAALPPPVDVLADPDLFGGLRPSSWVCGESPADKAVVSGLLESMGVEAIDAGELSAARLIEPMMMLVEQQTDRSNPPRRLALRLIEQGWDQLGQASNIFAS
jgi:hypothetical protein